MKELEKYQKKLQRHLDKGRYEHTLGVMYTCASLAMAYHYDIEKAMLAGLLHDCAKCLTDEKRLSICKKNKIPVTAVEKKNPFLLHAKVGAYLAYQKYGVSNPDILNAIRSHTTGRQNMSTLEKIVFIADYIEPGRTHAANLAEIRRIAFVDLDKAFVRILSDTLDYLKDTGNEIDPKTEETWKYYKK